MILREENLEEMKDLKEKIKKAVERGGRGIVGDRGRVESWDEKCKKKKREVGKELRNWRKKEKYKERKRIQGAM